MAKVLIVEDEENIRDIHKLAFMKEGFEVDAVASGQEAVDITSQKNYDVIILDMVMLNLSGLDFLRSFKAKLEHPSTKIIAFSNIDNNEIKQQARNLGAARYVTKARYTPKQVVEMVKEMLESPEADQSVNTSNPS